MTQKDNIRKRTRVGVRSTRFGPRSINTYEPFKLEQVILPAELGFVFFCVTNYHKFCGLIDTQLQNLELKSEVWMSSAGSLFTKDKIKVLGFLEESALKIIQVVGKTIQLL